MKEIFLKFLVLLKYGLSYQFGKLPFYETFAMALIKSKKQNHRYLNLKVG